MDRPEIEEDDINPRPQRIAIIMSERDLRVIRHALRTTCDASLRQEALDVLRRIEVQT